MITRLSSIIMKFLSSKLFFRLTLIWFGIQASWIALSGLYPMAFDENYHLGIIRVYTHHLLPIWTSHPSGYETLGAFSRDPSFLYHYLLNFVLRIIQPVVGSEVGQVIILRFINVGLFVAGILVFRRVLLRTKCSPVITNVALAMFAATPVVSLLAAQINYDNLLFLIIASAFLFLQKVADDIRQHHITSKNLLALVLICLTGSLTKYAFLPVDLAVVLVLGWLLIRYKNATWKITFLAYWQDFKKLSCKFKIICIVLLILLGGMFIERYAINAVRYKTPTPECDQVLSVGQCLGYGPWRRNYLTQQDNINGKLPAINKNPVNYIRKTWAPQMVYQLFFTIDGASRNYIIGNAYQVPHELSVIVLILGGLLYWIYFKRIRKKYRFGILFIPIGIYILALLSQNYSDFIHIGFAFAIQGRYLIPFLPIIYAVIAVAFSIFIRKFPHVKPIIATLALVVIITQAGGAGVYILRSDAGWYWPNRIVLKANESARKVIRPFVIGN